MKTLLFFTGSYPFSSASENTFIPQELAAINKRFKEIIVIPQDIIGTKEEISETNINVNTGYATFIASRSNKYRFLLRCILDVIFIKEILNRPFFFLRNPICIKVALLYRLIALMTEDWIEKYFLNSNRPVNEYILQTWWFNETTLGLANVVTRLKKSVVITRTHGCDLYEERNIRGYIPFRKYVINKLEGIFSVSQAGSNYLVDRYPKAQKKIHTALLGVPDPGFINNSSVDGVFRILTCSSLIPLKRIDLLILGLEKIGELYPDKKIHWTHIGSGPEMDKLIKLANSKLSHNIQFDFKGYLSKDEVYKFYQVQPVDLFVNISSTEGTPVSIMEAASCGIPILATAVGGNKEIVDITNGVLLSETPKPMDIANEVNNLMNDSMKLKSLRKGSRKRWYNSYNSESNYDKFADKVLKL